MCQAKPGPRCSAHARTALERAHVAYQQARDAVAAAKAAEPPVAVEERKALAAAMKKAAAAHAAAVAAFETTKAGQEQLRAHIEQMRLAGDDATEAEARLAAGVATRAQQQATVKAVHAIQGVLAKQYPLDDDQAEAVWRGAWKRARPNKSAPSKDAWKALLDEQIETLALDDTVTQEDFDALCRALTQAKNTVPDAHTFAAIKLLPERAEMAVKAVARQQDTIAALRGASSAEVKERYAAYREQYQREFANLPATRRPDPPAEWVRGFTTKDLMAVSAPADRATLYAMYRCQADPDAFGHNENQRFASIDLETAGPSGKDGFFPENGAIIEVGIVEYDSRGNEVGRYSQLIHPGEEVLGRCGTGAVNVHGITPADVADAPSWESVAPQVEARLNGRVMLAQNARFEKSWLSHHMGAQGRRFEAYGPTVDTLTLARQHFADLGNHRLETICQKVGVSYTGGHRAEHDADVAARSFFAMRSWMHAEYRSCPNRAAAAQPPRRTSTGGSKVTRRRGGEFDPSAVVDEWTVRPARQAPAA